MANRQLLGELKKCQIIHGDDNAALSAAAGISERTLSNRFGAPGDFTLDELRRLARRYDWDAPTVARFMGIRGA